MTVFNVGLAILVLVLAVWTVVTRHSFAALVGFTTYGLLLALVWVQLEGIDVALIEAALGTGLTSAILLGAGARLRAAAANERDERPGAITRMLAAGAAVCITLAITWAVLMLPDPAPSLAPETAAGIGSTGIDNPITAVLMAFRPMDTLLEAIVVLFALIGVWSLAEDKAWGGRPGPAMQHADPDGPLSFLARVLAPIGFVVAIYVFWIGADAPGGKFHGASLLAAIWLLVWVAGLAQLPRIGRRWLRVALIAGPLVFLAVGLAGIVTADAFLAYPDGLAKPLIKIIEWALLPSLGLALALLVAGAPQRGDT